MLTWTPEHQLLEITTFLANKKKIASTVKMLLLYYSVIVTVKMLLLYYSVIVRDLVLLDMFPSATCVEEKTINHSARYGLEIPGEYGLSEAKMLFNGWRKR